MNTPEFVSRFGRVMRTTFDQIYDGAKTGRFLYDDLHKTEKTHLGSLVEINIQQEFRFAEGNALDFSIAGVDVDCKFSGMEGRWMIPVEAVNRICLVITAEDVESTSSAGLVVASESALTAGSNRDGKRQLSAAGQKEIMWLWKREKFQPNILAQLDEDLRERILAQRPGQPRVNELFRRVQGRLIPRGTIATVARQDDYMKRVRDNGGARQRLRPEGILILGHRKSHRTIARGLGVPEPSMGEVVSVTVVQASDGEGVEIDRQWWRIARAAEGVGAAPVLPSR